MEGKSLNCAKEVPQEVVGSPEFGDKVCRAPASCTSDCKQAARDGENEKWPYCKADNEKGWEYCYCCLPDEACIPKFKTHSKSFDLCTPQDYFPDDDPWLMPVCATSEAKPDEWDSDKWLSCK